MQNPENHFCTSLLEAAATVEAAAAVMVMLDNDADAVCAVTGYFDNRIDAVGAVETAAEPAVISKMAVGVAYDH